MKVVNLFGQPSAGKSTTSAGLFHLMKLNSINCELVTEYAKDMVWRNLPPEAFQDQIYITAKQNHRLLRLKGKVDYVITDSPLLLGVIYQPDGYFDSYKPLVMEMFNSYDNINFFIKKVKEYNPIGRNQNESEAEKIGEDLERFLNDEEIEFSKVLGGETASKEIFDVIINGRLTEW